MLNKRLEGAVALGEYRVARLLDDDRAAHLVAYPDRVCRTHQRGLAVGRASAVGGKDAGERALHIAPARRTLRRRVVAEVGGGLVQHQCVEAPHRHVRELRPEPARQQVRLWRLERPGARQHRTVAVDHPDARGGAGKPFDDLRDLGRRGGRQRHAAAPRLLVALARERRDRIGGHGEQARAVVQRSGHGLGGPGERALLSVTQHALQFPHVLDAEPRQHEEHGQHEQQLRADRQRETLRLHGRRLRKHGSRRRRNGHPSQPRHSPHR